MMEREPSGFLPLALRMADAAAPIVRRYFRADAGFEIKSDTSPVTIADREAETAMRTLIEAECPGHGIEGEEHGRKDGSEDWVWYLDPIDGTKSFICGVPMFGTLIGLAYDGKPVLGVLDQPVTGERWHAAAGNGAHLNGAAIHTSGCKTLDGARLFTCSQNMVRGETAAAFERLRAAAYVTRYSADCYAFGLLAAGHIDIVVEAHLHEYDIAALVPIIEEAGGVVSDWRGAPLRFQRQVGLETVIASANPALHKQALASLAYG